jgi:hypothetical protein
VNSQDSVDIAPHQILHLNLKLFVCNGRKLSSGLAPILPNKRRANDKQEKGQAGEGGPPQCRLSQLNFLRLAQSEPAMS